MEVETQIQGIRMMEGMYIQRLQPPNQYELEVDARVRMSFNLILASILSLF
jgi:hypothetical protein